MMVRFTIGLLIVACAAAVTGCESSSGVIKPMGTVAVSLDAAKKRGSITVGLANLVSFTMPPTQPGYEWQISFHDMRYLKQETSLVPAKAPGDGATMSFLAVQPGSTRLRFVLVPISTDRSVNPLDQQDVAVTIR